MKKNQMNFGVERQFFRNYYLQSFSFVGQCDKSKQRSWRVEAGWLFKGGDQGLNASSERSESANEDILMFFFQLDLATRVQVLTYCI